MMDIKFTFSSYESFIDYAIQNGYHFSFFHDYQLYDYTIIIRHDVDFSLKKAVEFARIENKKSLKSTYFVLLTSSSYNLFSLESSRYLLEILKLGHEIGLHFDETKYLINNVKDLKKYINLELKVLSSILGKRVNVVSMHRPSRFILDHELSLGKGIINVYNKLFFKKIKYLSDSRMYWKENPFELVRNRTFKKIQILTHPIWYSNNIKSASEILDSYIKDSIIERYHNVKSNIKNADEFIKEEDYLRGDTHGQN